MIFNSVLISGANRGIGLQFVKEFLKLGNTKVNNILATYRDPSTLSDLNQLAESNKNLNLVQLDVKNYASFNEFCNKVSSIVGSEGLSLLVNNAGIATHVSLDDVTVDSMMQNFEVNAVAPLMLSKALLPLLKQSSKNGNRTVIANISSQLASVGDNQSGSLYAYRASKSALNQIGKSMSVDLKKHKIEVTSFHPGWVKTRMGGDKAPMTVEQSIPRIVGILVDEKNDINGKFLNFNGKPISW